MYGVSALIGDSSLFLFLYYVWLRIWIELVSNLESKCSIKASQKLPSLGLDDGRALDELPSSRPDAFPWACSFSRYHVDRNETIPTANAAKKQSFCVLAASCWCSGSLS